MPLPGNTFQLAAMPIQAAIWEISKHIHGMKGKNGYTNFWHVFLHSKDL